MENITSMLGCFASGPALYHDTSQVMQELAESKGEEFRAYIWGDKGICDDLKKLNHKDYGKDIVLILFQFHINPIPYLLEGLKKEKVYRKREKSMGVPIIVNDENFFEKNEEGRYRFLMESIFNALEIVEKIVKDKKLDTNIKLLKEDLEKVRDSILTFS